MLLVNPGVETRSGLLEEGEPTHHLRLLAAVRFSNSERKGDENRRRQKKNFARLPLVSS
jgi:hypothetical protein